MLTSRSLHPWSHSVLDPSIADVALAAIERDVSADTLAVQWAINAYHHHRLRATRTGRRDGGPVGPQEDVCWRTVPILAGVVGGWTRGRSAMLIGARAVQGVDAAIVAPATLLAHHYQHAAPGRSAITAQRHRSASWLASCWADYWCNSSTGERCCG